MCWANLRIEIPGLQVPIYMCGSSMALSMVWVSPASLHYGNKDGLIKQNRCGLLRENQKGEKLQSQSINRKIKRKREGFCQEMAWRVIRMVHEGRGVRNECGINAGT